MEDQSAEELAQILLKMGLVTQTQLNACWDKLNPRTASAEDLKRMLVNQGALSPLQANRLAKGDAAGLALGCYLIKYKIASGSFGRVYRGEDTRTGQSVAIKVLRERWSTDPHTIELFQREGKVGMTLRHQNIVQILAVDWDRASNKYYMAMEFVQGGDLRHILNSQSRMPPARALAILEDAATGLAHAFTQGLTHRDIKMSNILISVDQTAKLVDFGLAGLMAGKHQEPVGNGHVEVERTIEYAGLEKATGVNPGDTRSDIFFLGCVAYEMLSGRAPLRKPKDRHDRMNANRFSQVGQLTRAEVAAPPSVHHLVTKMMAFSPSQRYQTPWQLLDAVKAARNDLEGTNPQSDPKLRRPTLFIVEGDSRLQEALRDKLPEAGYRVMLARHPARALEQYRQQPYHGLLMDIGTAKQDGLATFEDVQSLAERRGRSCAGLVVLSQEQADWRGCIAARNHVAVMVRPFKFKDLITQLQLVLPTGTPADPE